MIHRYLFILFITVGSCISYGQTITESAARAELEKRGLDETRVKEELLKRGVDVDNIDPNNKQQVLQYEKVIREVITMLEAEKKAKGTQQPNNTMGQKPATGDKTRSVDSQDSLSKQTPDIQKAVKDGATVEEAVSEKIQEKDKQNLPAALTYGQHIFRDKSLKLFRTAEDAKPPKTYVLGPGDKIAVSIWGPTQENFALEIQKDGYIQPTNLPRYYLSGLTIEAAENLLFQRLRTKYFFAKENFELTVTTSRTINVNILGEVFNNGSFNISAVSSSLKNVLRYTG